MQLEMMCCCQLKLGLSGTSELAVRMRRLAELQPV